MIEDPFPVLEEIRVAGRIVWNELAQAWMVTGYDDCTALLDTRQGISACREHYIPRFSSGSTRRRSASARASFIAGCGGAAGSVLHAGGDAEELGSARGTRSSISCWARWSRVRSGSSWDDFTKVAVIIVGELLGVPEERHEDFRRWSNTSSATSPLGTRNPEARREMDGVIAEAKAYLTGEIERHRRERPR